MSTRNFLVSLFVLFVLILTACGSPAPVVQSTPQPPSKIELVENGDDVKDVHITSHGVGEYEDVSLEEGMAEAQFLCSETFKDLPGYTFSVGVASLLNTSELLVTDCPALAIGVRTQIVNTSTHFYFECRNCTIAFAGEYEYGEGVSAWRGIVTVTVTPGNTEPAVLVLIPVALP